MTKEEFISLIVKDICVEYPFHNEIQLWNMKNFTYENGKIRHNRLPLIIDNFIKNARNPHKREATHG